MKTKINRRQLTSALGAGSMLWLAPPRLMAQEQDPHFFINVFVIGGWDPHSLFDARPLAMTDAGYLQNYLYRNRLDNDQSPLPEEMQAPVLYQGNNGQSTLRTRLTDPLMPHMGDLSVINGVVMAGRSSVGHEQNTEYCYTGSIFGGESFVPTIGQQTSSPLESIQFGATFNNPSNFSRSVTFNSDAGSIVEDLQNAPDISLNTSTGQRLSRLLGRLQEGNGRFSAGVGKMLTALSEADALKHLLVSQPGFDINLPPAEDTTRVPSIATPLRSALGYLFSGAAGAATIVLDARIDFHAGEDAATTPATYGEIVRRIAFFMDALKNTEFREGKSFLDVTTIMVSSEFSRTMRNLSTPANEEFIGLGGTDHNPFSNSILIGGKGIRGGMVVGETDMQWSESGLAEPSGAHRSIDPDLVLAAGKPFDFVSESVRQDSPASYKRDDYLTIDSVINTVLKCCHAPEEKLRTRRANQPYPILTKLLG